MSIVNNINFKQWTSEQAGEQAQVTYEKYKKIKSFQDVGYLLSYYVVSGGEVTKNIKRNDIIDVMDIVASLDNNILSRDGTSFETKTSNTLYYLDFEKTGDWHWGTVHAPGVTGEDFLTVAEVATDALGMVSLVIDKRGYVGGMRLKDEYGLEEYAKTADVDAQFAEITAIVNRPNGTNDTANIQSVLDTGASDILIPDGVYWIDAEISLIPRSNQNIKLSKNAILKAIPTSNANYQIFDLKDVSNVEIEGGTLIGERYQHQGSDGQWGYGVKIGANTDNILIKNMILKDFWGDGIYIGSLTTPAKNVRIDNIIADNNRRQGCSITYAENVNVTNSIFKNTNGSAPESGIDIEPNSGTYVKNVVIDNCQFLDNAGSGIDFVGAYGIGIENFNISNCKMVGNRNGIGLINCKTIDINNCIISENTNNGIGFSRDVINASFYKVEVSKNGSIGVSLIVSGQVDKSENINFYDCIIKNNGQAAPNARDGVRIDQLDTTGVVRNVSFTNCKFVDDQATKTQRYGFSSSAASTISGIILGIGCYFSGNASGSMSSTIATRLYDNLVQTKQFGTTAQRPTAPKNGECYYDTTLSKPIWFYSPTWRDVNGATV